jgi:hypothetical protein
VAFSGSPEDGDRDRPIGAIGWADVAARLDSRKELLIDGVFSVRFKSESNGFEDFGRRSGSSKGLLEAARGAVFSSSKGFNDSSMRSATLGMFSA